MLEPAVGRQAQLADAAARTAAHHADVVGDFVAAHRELLQGTVGLDDGVMGGECLEFVGGGDQRMTRGFRHVGGHSFRVAVRCVQSGADGRAPQGEFGEVTEGRPQGAESVVELGHIPSELLPEGQGRGVHEVGSANLDHFGHLLGFGGQGVPQPLHPGNGRAHNPVIRRDVHRRGTCHWNSGTCWRRRWGARAVPFTQRTASQHVLVGDDLIDVHVGLGAGTGARRRGESNGPGRPR